MEAKLDHFHLLAAYVPRRLLRDGMSGQGAISALLTGVKNVDTFNNHPSMKWYWIAAIPMVSPATQGAEQVQPLMVEQMGLVLGLWVMLKHFMPQASRLLRYTEAELDLLRTRPG